MLFEGPYKSVNISGISEIALLSGHIHHDHNYSSSLPEYINARVTPWVKPDAVLSFFAGPDNTIYKGELGYKGFAKDFQISEDQKDILKTLAIEDVNKHSPVPPAPQKAQPQVKREPVVRKADKVYLSPWQRVPEMFGIVVIFVLLLGVGMSNINADAAEKTLGASTTAPLSAPNDLSTPAPTDLPKKPLTYVVVNIKDGSSTVNIRLEPKISSEKVGTANGGDALELVSEETDWFQVKLADGTIGYISKKYSQIRE